MRTITIGEIEEGQRLDRFLKKYLKSAPLSLIYRMIRKDIKVNGRREDGGRILQPGDEVSISMAEELIDEFVSAGKDSAQQRQFGIAYEDGNVLAAEKPFGLLTHGDGKEKKNTLANQAIAYLIGTGDYRPGANSTFTPSPVGRLDRNTSGLVLFGKSPKALRDLNTMFRHRGDVDKYYLTMVKGRMTERLVLRSRMEKDSDKNLVRLLPEEGGEGRLMITEANPIAAGKRFSLIEVKLVTGRSHQIRVHLAEAGYPIIGDKKYGDRAVNAEMEKKFGLTAQFLHAWRMEINRGTESLEYLTGAAIESTLPERLGKISGALVPGAGSFGGN